jgi:hypothetical protein
MSMGFSKRLLFILASFLLDDSHFLRLPAYFFLQLNGSLIQRPHRIVL